MNKNTTDNQVNLIEEAAKAYIDSKNKQGEIAYAVDSFIAGWKTNPATWTETEVHQLLSKVIYDVTKKQFTMGGCSVSGHRARMLMEEFKNR